MKVVVIGHPQAVLGFSLVGLEGRPATSVAEVSQALDEALAAPDTGIVLVTSDVAGLITARMEDLKLHSTIPLVVEIPAPGQDSREQGPSLSEVVFRAIGVKI
jgi:V/A-type H+-transporting ATPase subunit F